MPPKMYSAKRTYKKPNTPPKTSDEDTKLRTKVKQIVRTMQEAKQFTYDAVANTPITTWSASGPCTYYDLNDMFSNSLSPGAQDGERIGDRVNTRQFLLKGFLNCPTAASPATSYPTNVRLVVLKDKTSVRPSTNSFSDFYEAMTPAASTPTRDLGDIIRTINSERYTVLAQRLFKIGPATNGAAGMNANNDYKVNQFFRIDLTKHVKQLVFDTVTDACTSPQSLYLLVIAVNADGVATAASTTMPVNYTLYVDYKYTDS